MRAFSMFVDFTHNGGRNTVRAFETAEYKIARLAPF
jgi:hypothetical protein